MFGTRGNQPLLDESLSLTIHDIHGFGPELDSMAGSKTLTTAEVKNGHALAIVQRGVLELVLQEAQGHTVILRIRACLLIVLILVVRIPTRCYC